MYRRALVPFKSVETIAYSDVQLMKLYARAATKYNELSDNALTAKLSDNKLSMHKTTTDADVTTHKQDSELKAKLSDNNLSMHKTTTDADVTTHKQDSELKAKLSDNNLSMHKTTTDAYVTIHKQDCELKLSMHQTSTDADVIKHKQDCELKLSMHQTSTDADAKIALATQKKENNSKEEIIATQSFDSLDTCCGENENLNPAYGHDDRHSSSGGNNVLDWQYEFGYSTNITKLTSVVLDNDIKIIDLIDTGSDKDRFPSPSDDSLRKNDDAGSFTSKYGSDLPSPVTLAAKPLALSSSATPSLMLPAPPKIQSFSSSSPVQRTPFRVILGVTSRVLTSRSAAFPVAFSPMTSSTSSQPITPAIRKVKDQKSSNYTCDVDHFTYDDELPLIGINGEKEMDVGLFSHRPICLPIVRMPPKKRLLARKEKAVLTGRG